MSHKRASSGRDGRAAATEAFTDAEFNAYFASLYRPPASERSAYTQSQSSPHAQFNPNPRPGGKTQEQRDKEYKDRQAKRIKKALERGETLEEAMKPPPPRPVKPKVLTCAPPPYSWRDYHEEGTYEMRYVCDGGVAEEVLEMLEGFVCSFFGVLYVD